MVIAAVLTLLGATTVYAEELFRIFRAADGSSVLYSESENETAVTFDDISTDYAAVINERLYFVLGDIQKDVTDVCSDTSYYRHEIINADGSRNVIFVGGTVDNFGWVELIFDSQGNYVTNKMRIRGEESWSDQAMHNEGVPCGDPVLDGLITK